VLLELVPVLLELPVELVVVLLVVPVLLVAELELVLLFGPVDDMGMIPPPVEDERRLAVVEVVTFATALLTLVATTGLVTARGAEGSFLTVFGTDFDILFIFRVFFATGAFLAAAAKILT